MPNKDIKQDPKRASGAPLLFSCRLNLFILCLFAVISFMFIRLNINFALVCMVRRVTPNATLLLSDWNTTIGENNGNHADYDEGYSINLNGTVADRILPSDEYEECQGASTWTNSSSPVISVHEGEFEWSKETQGAILGSFFYGFIFTQIPGGWISDRFGGKKAFIMSIAIMSVLCLISPIAAMQGPEYLFAVRLLQGFSHGATLPCINVLATNWSPPTERAFLLGIAYGGFSVAMALVFPVSAFLCETFGWEYIFYATGGYGVIWCIIAYFLIYDWPEDHPKISKKELQFLQDTRTVQQGDTLKVPWKKIATSVPINVIHITHTCMCWGVYTFVMYLPTFMKEVLKFNVSQNGIFSSFPFIAMLIFHLFAGTLFDWLRRKKLCSLINLRKIFNTFGMGIPSISILMLGFLSCTDNLLPMLAISAGEAFLEFAMMGGYLFSIFDLAPRYAGLLTGLTNTFGNLPGFLCPVFVSYMTPNGTRKEWIVVFGIAAAVNALGALVYLLFGRSSLLPWALPKNTNGVHAKNDTEMKVLQEKLLEEKSQKV